MNRPIYYLTKRFSRFGICLVFTLAPLVSNTQVETNEKMITQTPDLYSDDKTKNSVQTGEWLEFQNISEKESGGKGKGVVKPEEGMEVKSRKTWTHKKKKKRISETPNMDSDFDVTESVTAKVVNPNLRPKPKPRGDVGETQGFTVKTVKVNQPRASSIQLLSPPHNSTLTPGVVTFTWSNENTKAKSDLILERTSGGEHYVHRSRNPKKQIYVGPGEYRWQVIAGNGESRWRLFKVVSFKSKRSYSSEAQTSTQKGK